MVTFIITGIYSFGMDFEKCGLNSIPSTLPIVKIFTQINQLQTFRYL